MDSASLKVEFYAYLIIILSKGDSEEKHRPCAYCIFYIKGEAEQLQVHEKIHSDRQIETFIQVPIVQVLIF